MFDRILSLLLFNDLMELQDEKITISIQFYKADQLN